MKLINEDKNDFEFDYQLLDRLKSDCKYFLTHGNKNDDMLWAGSQEEQIETMKKFGMNYLKSLNGVLGKIFFL